MVFFSNAFEAREAGYRACERCRPADDEVPRQDQLIQELCEFINENPQERLTLEKLSERSGLSPFHLQRVFKKITGVTPREYGEAVRLNYLKMSLKSGNSVRRSTYSAGYNTTGWLYFRPNEKLGMSPSRYKSGAEGLEISYVIRDCPLGKLLVATTERGVCLVDLADSEGKLLSHLRSEFPKADLAREEEHGYGDNGMSGKKKKKGDGDDLSRSVERILDYLTRGSDLQDSNLPLDLRATAFQSRVWKELRSIPYGTVRSYSEVARRIGLPKATRAVANACASNPVPFVIPCHRVVRKNGDLGGYGLGVERKKILLEKEGVTFPLPLPPE